MPQRIFIQIRLFAKRGWNAVRCRVRACAPGWARIVWKIRPYRFPVFLRGLSLLSCAILLAVLSPHRQSPSGQRHRGAESIFGPIHFIVEEQTSGRSRSAPSYHTSTRQQTDRHHTGNAPCPSGLASVVRSRATRIGDGPLARQPSRLRHTVRPPRTGTEPSRQGRPSPRRVPSASVIACVPRLVSSVKVPGAGFCRCRCSRQNGCGHQAKQSAAADDR